MKTFRLKSSLLAGVAALMLLFPAWKDSKLTDITKPYLGTYECKSAMLGDEEYLEDFSYIQLELKGDGTFVLYYKPKDGAKHEETGKYVYDDKENTLCLSDSEGSIKRKFPLKKGELLISLRVGGKYLMMKFEQK